VPPIAEAGDIADRMFFITSGEVEIRMEHGTVFLGEGNFFGELALLNQAIRSTTVVAYRDCQLLVLEAGALQQLMDQDAALAKKIMDEARERVEAGKKVLGEIAEEELEQAGIVPSHDDHDLQPELFEDGRPAKAD
jgi:voltage-gated potassium channel